MTLAQPVFGDVAIRGPAIRARPERRSDAARVEFVDMAFTASDATMVLDRIAARAVDAPFAYVVTPNVDHVVRLQLQRSDLWPAYRAAWMTLCDSRILARLARMMDFTLPVVTGSDLTRQMFDQVVRPSDRISILGGDPELIAQLSKRYGLRDVRHYNPPMGFIHDPVEVTKAVRFIVQSRARYHFLAVGSPQQEILAHRVGRAGGATGIALCVGASLDFLTGVQERAAGDAAHGAGMAVPPVRAAAPHVETLSGRRAVDLPDRAALATRSCALDDVRVVAGRPA